MEEGPSTSSRKRTINSSVKKEVAVPLEMISYYNPERIHFDGIKLYGNGPPMKTFMESSRVFSSIILENVTLLDDHNLFWEKSGKNFTELIIKKCSISAVDFLSILKNLTNLTKLVIIESSEFCESLLIEIENADKVLFASSSKLSSFSIDESWTDLGSDALLKWFTEMPNLTEFEISLTNEHLCIVDCIKLWEKQLTSLRLKNEISVETRAEIYKLNISELQVFQIGSPDQYDERSPYDDYTPNEDDRNGLIEFISRQHNLLELCIGICEIDEKFLIKLSGNVPNLKILGIYNTQNFEDGVSNSEVLAMLGKLSKVHLSISAYNAFDRFLDSMNTNLTHLTYDVPIEDHDFRYERRRYDIQFADIDGFKNLIHLDVSDQHICNYDIQSIFRSLTGLEFLRVHSKYTLSDFAFNGKGYQYPNAEKYVRDSIKGQRKGPFYLLKRLEKLIELDIQSTDNKFTDLALEKISKLKTLRILNLTNYKKITISGIAKVVTMCKNLEQITINGCDQKIANEIGSHFKKRVVKVIYDN